MTAHNHSPSAAEARELLARAEGLGSTAASSAAWPVAMTFTSLAILGSMLMIGLHIVGHTGYGAPVLTIATTVWAIVTASVWPMLQRSTKAGYTKRFTTSLIAYFALYTAALTVGAIFFRDGNIWFYAPAAAALAAVGLAAAFRELRA